MTTDLLTTLSVKGVAERNAIKWVSSNPGMYELLGKVTDEEIAEKYNCKLNRVKRYRRALGIKFKRGRRSLVHDPSEVELEKTSVAELEEGESRLSLDEISSAVLVLGEEKINRLSEKYDEKYPGILELLGRHPDQFVGNKYGISRESVRLIRNKFNIQSSQGRTTLDALKARCSMSIDKNTAKVLLEIGKFISDNLETILEAAQTVEGEE